MIRLNKEQKGAIFLLQIGAFLEYFDLMLFVHMAVVLNEIFFPKFDPFTNSLLSAFTFCSTFALKPFGALLFGYSRTQAYRYYNNIDYGHILCNYGKCPNLCSNRYHRFVGYYNLQGVTRDVFYRQIYWSRALYC